MAELSQTKNLKIPRILGSSIVMRENMNNAIDKIDSSVLSVTHEASKAHFELWKPNQAYKKQDVVKTSACPSWGFFMCSTAGMSGNDEPQGFGEGDVVSDGTAVWVLKKLGGTANDTAIDFWKNNTLYAKGTLVLYERLLYRSVTEHISGTGFEQIKWMLVNVGFLPDWEQGVTYAEKMLVYYDGVIYRCILPHTSFNFPTEKGRWEIVIKQSAFIRDWQANTTYEENETIFYDDKLYRAISSHTSSNIFTLNDWELISAKQTVIHDWAPSRKYVRDECIFCFGHLYRCLSAHTSANFISDNQRWEPIDISYLNDWKNETKYKKDELVRYQRLVYRCTQEHTSTTSFAAANWEILNIGYIPDWQPEASYTIYMVIVHDGVIYRCNKGHTASSIFVNDTAYWNPLAIGYIPKWQPNTSYIEYQVVTENDKILRCLMPHQSRIAYDVKEAEYWEIIARLKIILNDWIKETEYEEKEVVVYQGKVYRSKYKHNSNDKFKQVYWEPLLQPDSSGLKQVEIKGVVAPYTLELPINYTLSFKLPPPEILKYDPNGGAQDQLLAVEKFDNADAGDFIVDGKDAGLSEQFIFDGVMKINTEYRAVVGIVQDLSGNTVCETEFIDFKDYKKIEKIRGGFL